MTALERSGIDRRRLLRAAGASALVAIAGCAGDDGDDAEGESDDEEDADPESVDVPEDATWRTASLADVTTDEEFRIADLDRPAVVHTFARGCAVCHAQQREFGEFYATAESDVEIVDLTIDPNDDPDEIREYAEEDDFGWRFGTSPERVTGSLVDSFGQDVTVSAASPVVLVCPGGEVYSLEKVVDGDQLESVLAEVC